MIPYETETELWDGQAWLCKACGWVWMPRGDLSAYGERFEGVPCWCTEGAQRSLLVGRPGTALALILKAWGLKQHTGCGCSHRIRLMNLWGPEGCQEPDRFEEIVGWLVAEARRRWVPFSRVIAVRLLRAAIERSRPPGSD